MKLFLFVFIFFLEQMAFAVENKTACRFPNQMEQMTIEDCAQVQQDSSFKIEKSILKKIEFDKNGLAGGSIGKSGCYWLNKKGLLRKTHCFDNGADSFNYGLARFVDSNGKFGYMNQRLQVIIPAQYTFAFPFEYNYAKVCNGCQIEKLENSEHSLVKGGQWLVINKTGKIVTRCSDAKDANACPVPSK